MYTNFLKCTYQWKKLILPPEDCQLKWNMLGDLCSSLLLELQVSCSAHIFCFWLFPLICLEWNSKPSEKHINRVFLMICINGDCPFNSFYCRVQLPRVAWPIDFHYQAELKSFRLLKFDEDLVSLNYRNLI